MIDLTRVEMANPIDKYIINEQGRISLEGAKQRRKEMKNISRTGLAMVNLSM